MGTRLLVSGVLLLALALVVAIVGLAASASVAPTTAVAPPLATITLGLPLQVVAPTPTPRPVATAAPPAVATANAAAPPAGPPATPSPVVAAIIPTPGPTEPRPTAPVGAIATPTRLAVPSQPQLPPPIAAGGAHPVGTNVVLDDVRWRVTKVEVSEKLRTQSNEERAARGRFVVAMLEIENTGDQLRSVTPLGPLLDGQGRAHPPSIERFAGRPPQLLAPRELPARSRLEFSVVYDVPAGTTGLRVRVTNLNPPAAKDATLSVGDATT